MDASKIKVIKINRTNENLDTQSCQTHTNWFNLIYGFDETVERCNANLSVVLDANNIPRIKSSCSKKSYRSGLFSTPTIEELRNKSIELLNKSRTNISATTTYSHVVIDDVLEMHHKYPRSTFQVASQFNCLEFVSPELTQGPACSLACASGTIYRNYFAVPPTNSFGIIGQSQNSQFNLLDNLERMIDNSNNNYWHVNNGYINSKRKSLAHLNKNIQSCNIDNFIKNIKVGVHDDVGVVFSSRYEPIDEDLYVTQVYCSAVSCNYTSIPRKTWQPIAEIILQSQYEGAIWSAVLNHLRGGTNKLFLTFIGGGVFGNKNKWIGRSISRALNIATKYDTGLDIIICHYKYINEEIKNIIDGSNEINV